MRPSRLLVSCSLLALAACSSKVSSDVDQSLLAKANTITGCMPGMMAKLDELVAFVDLWRLNDSGNNPADPSGLTWTEDGAGVITYSINVGGFTIGGTITFYSPTGSAFDATLTAAPSGSLSEAMEDAATQLRNAFSSGRPFIVADWTLTGTGVSGSGAFTGMIAGSTNQNELEELITTTTTVSGGPPANADGTITTTGSETCVFTFNVPSLLTDQSPSQEYPEGTITFSLENQTSSTTVAGSIAFDGTVTAIITVTGLSGHFEINLDTYAVTHVA